jgi:hypothetical protein
VQVERSTPDRHPSHTSFVIRLDLGEGLTSRERTILFHSARRCDVEEIISGETSFEYRWLKDD